MPAFTKKVVVRLTEELLHWTNERGKPINLIKRQNELYLVLKKAETMQKEAKETRTQNTLDYEDIPELNKTKKALEKFYKQWRKLPDNARMSITWDLYHTSDFMGDRDYIEVKDDQYILNGQQLNRRVEYMALSLLDSIVTNIEINKKPQGAPSKSKIDGVLFEPLIVFGEQLKPFWEKETGYAFRPLFEKADELDESDIRQPNNPATFFFCKCAAYLNSTYTVSSCDAVMRHIAKDSVFE